MPDIEAVLSSCLETLSKEYDIEVVNHVPKIKNSPQGYIWKVLLLVGIADEPQDIEVYMHFPSSFPNSMPNVFVTDDRFKHLPHISAKSRKLCTYEDGLVYDADNVEGLIRDNISSVRHWLEDFYGRDNADEYIKEIRSYWQEQYEGENAVDDYWILVGDIPETTCEMTGIVYADKNLKDRKTFVISIVATDNDNKTIECIKLQHEVINIPVLYLASLKISDTPPFCMTGRDLVDRISDYNDKALFKKFLNRNGKANILFPIGIDNAIGGVIINSLNVNRNGFRNTSLTPYYVLTSLDGNKKLERLHASVYSSNRIARRTAGGLMERRHFLIAGLGSIGSNLCYYLNGYNNAAFTLLNFNLICND